MIHPLARRAQVLCAPMLLILGLGLGACAPATNWRETLPPDAAGLRLLFPCKPDHASRSLPLTGVSGGPITLHLLSCDADGATWALSYADMGTPERRVQALSALQAALIRNVSPPGGPAPKIRAVPEQAPAIQGRTAHPQEGARWIQGHRPDPNGGKPVPVTIGTWQFSRGLHVFQASVWQNPLLVDDPRLRTFIEGFTFAD